MIIKYENKNDQVFINGELTSDGLLESIQWDQGIPKWQAAIQLTYPNVVVNDEVYYVGDLDDKPRVDFHIDEETLEIESVQIFI